MNRHRFVECEFKRSLDVGARARNMVNDRAVVRELEKVCRNPVQR
jgi:arsenite oxidase small subunit